MMVTLCLNVFFYKSIKSALLDTFLVMFLQSFAFLHNILFIIANHAIGFVEFNVGAYVHPVYWFQAATYD